MIYREPPNLGNASRARQLRRVERKLQALWEELQQLKPEGDDPWFGGYQELARDVLSAHGRADRLAWEVQRFHDPEHANQRARILHHQERAQGGDPVSEVWLSSRSITQGECASRAALRVKA